MKNITTFLLLGVIGFVAYKIYKNGVKIGSTTVGGSSNSSTSNSSTELNIGQIGGGVSVADPLSIGGNQYTSSGQTFSTKGGGFSGI